PPQMVGRFAELNRRPDQGIEKMALVVDSRAGSMFDCFGESLDELRAAAHPYRLLFLDADDAVLLRRYKEGRRKHPLLGEGCASVEEAIARERALLQTARERADFLIDTSNLPVAQLKERLTKIFIPDARQAMMVECISFGFKNGLPKDADLVFDVRCLPNPFYLPALRPLTGLDAPVRDYVMRFPQSRQLLDRLIDLIDFLLPQYVREGKSQLVIAIGCTGGQHRSVTFAQALGEHLQELGCPVSIQHRDRERAAEDSKAKP
ncbi:MAG: RNase adapter RapZ, partial [Clostridia bacterium]|nr:RNase adapter RapZ [Clostridia bacterium]